MQNDILAGSICIYLTVEIKKIGLYNNSAFDIYIWYICVIQK